MGKLIVIGLAALGLSFTASAQRTANWTLAQRIGHPDLEKVKLGHSHGDAGFNRCAPLIDASQMDVNIIFILRCQMMPQGGVAEHFHNTAEEMFTILNGEAEFTIDSHTSLVKGPGGAPMRMAHSHAVYNPTNEVLEYINWDVSYYRGHADAFNLGDSRNKDVPLDAIPQFMFMHLDKALLKPVQNYHGGEGTVQYRRALDGMDVFLTNWAYMDHEVIPPGASDGLHRHAGVEEVYFVMDGNGTFQLNDETSPIKKWDAIPVRFNEAHSITNNGTGDLELLIMGVAAQKNVLDTELGAMPRGPGR
jgi:mannose-6-phosphate isomerase-like protein (cupin superfamily)